MVQPKLLHYKPAAAAAAKSLQSCPTLCDPIDRSPPGSPVPGILQARTLEWVATGTETLGVQQSTPIAAEMWPHLRTRDAHGGSAAVNAIHPAPLTPALCQAPDPYGTDSAQSSRPRGGDTHARLSRKCAAPGSITDLQIVGPKG